MVVVLDKAVYAGLSRSAACRMIYPLFGAERGSEKRVGRQLRAIDIQRQLLQSAGEAERHLVIVSASMSKFRAIVMIREHGVLHALAQHFIAVKFEDAAAPTAPLIC